MNLFKSTISKTTLVALLLLSFFSMDVLADGTRQVSPLNNINGTALLVAPDVNIGPFRNAPNEKRLRFTIVNNATENLYFGFQPRTYDNGATVLKSNVYYRIFNAAGTQVAGPTLMPTAAGAGFISNYAQAFAGPNIGGATPAGYTPFLFDPATNGDFYIELYASNDLGVTADIDQITGRVTFPLFDLTVSTTSNVQSVGRLWSREWGLAATNLISGNFENTWNSSFAGRFIAYTPDGFKLQVNFAPGFRPLGFEIAMNFEGIGTSGNWVTSRRSVNANGVVPDIINGYRVFLTEPDDVAFPDGIIGSAAVTSNIFGCSGSYYIPYYKDQPGDIALLIDLNGVAGFQPGSADVLIQEFNQPAGNNVFQWNGLNGLGVQVPNNFTALVTAVLYQGRTNIPMFDAELNTNGLSVTALFPNTGNRRIYWDDSALTPFGTCITQEENITTAGINRSGLFDGVFGPTHAWDGSAPGLGVPPPVQSPAQGQATIGALCDDYGNNRIINSWFYASDIVSNTLTLSLPVCDNDRDGIANNIDIDDDNDGIYDVVEYAGLPNPWGDTDADGIPNFLDPSASGFVDANFNGVDDRYDFDGDGIIDQFDLDSDGDGIPDNIEAQTTVGYVAPTGTINAQGVFPSYFSLGGLTPVNTDGADTPDYKDLNSDNQGGNDTAEAAITLSGLDNDKDGLDNNQDSTPNTGYGDVNGIYDNTQFNNFPDADADVLAGGDVDWRDAIFNDRDNDGVADLIDLDDDNDGVLDTVENGGLPEPLADADGDGILNYLDPTFPGRIDLNSDGVDDRYDFDRDGIINQWDLDSDNDGIFDVLEAGGIDSDNNGTANDNDNNVNNIASNGIPTSAGAGTTPLDFGNNGTPNYLNLDSDEDGCFDVREAGFVDQNANGVLGNNPTIVNANGVVTGTAATNGYTGTNANVTTAGTNGAITAQPAASTAIATGSSGTIAVTATGTGLVYQWQISTNNGTSWTNLSNGGTSPVYTGASSPALGLSNVPAASNGNLFRVLITSSTYACTNLTSNSSTLNVAASADLSITKTVTSSPVIIGQTVTYLITVTNNGPSTSTGFSVVDNLPAGLTYNSNTSPSSGTFNSSTMTWTATSTVLTPGQSATLSIVCNVLSTGPYTNQAVVTGNVADPTPANNTVNTPLTPLASANLSMLKSVSNPSPQVGSTVTFTLTVNNPSGGSPATNVQITDLLSAGYTYVAGSSSPAGYNATNGNWPLVATLASNTTLTYTIQATVNTAGPYGNTASVSSPTPDPNTGNNASTITPSPVPVTDLQITKTITPANPAVGSTVTFNLTVLNNGPSNATGVQVIDNLAAASGFTFGTLTPPAGTTWTPATNTWAIGNLNNGASIAWSYTATVNATGNYTNTATVSGNQIDNTPINNTSSATAGAVAQSDLAIVKTALTPTPLVGGQATFTLTATNNGPSAATAVNVFDNLPAGYANPVSVPAGAFVGNTWAIGNLAVGASTSITITADVLAAGPYNNTATIAGAQADPIPANNTSTVNITPTPSANVSIVKTVSNTTPNVGSNVTFTITVTNNGPSTATNVQVIDTLRSGYTFVSFTAPAGQTYNTSGANIWRFTGTPVSIASGSSVVYTIVATVRSSGIYTNCANVTATEIDLVSSNNRSCAATVSPVPQTDLTLVKTASTPTPNVGATVNFTLTANNVGPSNATGVTVTDIIPSGYSFVGTIPAGTGSFNAGTSTYTWPIGTLNSGPTTQSVQLILQVNATGNYQNCATISGNQVDPVSLNNTSCSTPTPVPQANISVVKEAVPTNGNVGSNVSFVITVTNNGPSAATNVIISDTLPSGYIFTSAIPATYNPTTNQWPAIPTMANGSVLNYILNATIAPNGTPASYTNTAFVNSPTADSNLVNNADTARVNVTQIANLAIAKTFAPANPTVGSQITFTITASNLGASNATGVVVNDPLPSGYTLDSIVTSQGTYTAPNWDVGSVLANGTASMLVYVKALATGNLTNTATISGAQLDPVTTNNTVSVTPILTNLPPVANNDTTTTLEDFPVSINIVNPTPPSSSTDTDIDGTVNPATVDLIPGGALNSSFTSPAGNNWSVTSGGVVTFTPALNFNGIDSVAYTVRDDDGATSNIAYVFVTVISINDAPVAVNNAVTIAEDSVLVLNITLNDTDVDGFIDSSTVDLNPSLPGNQTSVTTSAGTWVVSPTGVLTFTPIKDTCGITATLPYTVNDNLGLISNIANVVVTIVCVNDPPVAIDDDTTTLEDTPITFNILVNDFDIDGFLLPQTTDLDTLTPGIQTTFTDNNGGLWSLDLIGNVTYSPPLNFVGTQVIYYSVCDTSLLISNIASITVVVLPVNDTVSQGNETMTIPESSPATVSPDLTNNNIDPDGTTVTVTTIVSTSAGSIVTINPGDSTITITPPPFFNGIDTIVYTVCDSGFPLPIICVNDTLFVTVTSVNDAPVANTDLVATPLLEDGANGTVAILLNDTDPDGNPTAPTNGAGQFTVDLDTITPGIQTTVTNATGVWTYNPTTGIVTFDPANNYNGTAVLTYELCDIGSLCDTANILFTVLPVNDAPVAVNDTSSTNEDIPVTFSVTNNDSDIDGNLNTSTVVFDTINNAPNGTWSVNNLGIVTYAPAPNFNGISTITYTVLDSAGAISNIATIVVIVNPINDAPIVDVDFAFTSVNLCVSGDMLNTTIPLQGDYDPDSTLLFVTTFTLPQLTGSTITIDSTGLYTYCPGAGQTGFDTILVTVCDSGNPLPSICVIDTLIISISANPPPIANDDAAIMNEDFVGGVSLNVTNNDTDLGGNIVASSVDFDTIVGNPNILVNQFGTWTTNPFGTLTFVPIPNFCGIATAQYWIYDNNNQISLNPATITITVRCINDAPVTTDITVSTPINTPIGVNVSAGTSDIENNPITYTYGAPITSGAPAGIPTITIDGNGAITVTPSNNFVGVITIPFTVCDLSPFTVTVLCDSGFIVVNVVDTTGTNSAPTANNDLVTTPKDSAIVVNPLGNDIDPDGDLLTVTILTAPSNPGSTAGPVNPNGTIPFTPAPGFTGVDSIQYVVCDPSGLCDTAFIVITVSPGFDSPNTAPIATNDYAFTPEGTQVVYNVLTNDTDPNGDGITITPTIISGPTNGLASINPNTGEITYTPILNFFGQDTVEYQICDIGAPSLCDNAFFVVTVNPINNGPTTTDITVSTSINTPIGVNVGAGTSDPENDPLIYTYDFSQLPNTIISGNGVIFVGPNPAGTYVIPFQVCDSSLAFPAILCDSGYITVIVVDTSGPNFAPIANNDQVTTPKDSSIIINPIANDFDPDLDPLTVSILPGSPGTVDPLTGLIAYNPISGFTGLDSIQYAICDPSGLCDTAWIYVTVTPSVVTPNVAPIAIDDFASTNENSNVTIPVLNNDSDPNGNGLNNPTVLIQPTNGLATVTSTGDILYDPNTNFYGTDTLTYVVCDNGTPSLCDTAIVIITISPINNAPIADDIIVNMNENSSLGVNVGASVSDPENNPLTFTYGPSTPGITFVSTGNGVITVTSGLPGTYLIPYTVCDSSAFAPTPLCASGAITVTVIDTIAGVNNPPVANNDQVTTPINMPVIVNPLANDFDVDGDILTATLLPGSPATIDPTTGLISYTPATGFVGVDSIAYSVCDPSGACDTAFIVVTVSPVVDSSNAAPIATDDYATTDIITPVTVAVLNNDSDPNGNALTTPVTILTNPSTTGSVATANPNGTITFTPGPLFTAGTDSVQYLVCDNGAPTLCDTAWLFVTISPINNAPIADDILVNMNENSSLGVNVGAAVSDPENNPLTYTYGPSTPGITFVSTGNGVITVTSGLPGTYLIPYTVCDSSAFAPTPLCASGVITVIVIDTIVGVNNPPVANNDLVTTPINTPVIINPIANDFDVDGDILTATLLPGSPATIDPTTGLISYTPATGFVGVDSIAYSVCDPSGACDTAFIVVTVSPVVDSSNVAPIATDDYATTDIITPVTVAVLNNDSDPNGNALTTPVTILTNPSTTGSVATANPNGTITFTPGPLFTAGTDSVQYLVCDNGAPTLCDTAWLFVTIAPINNAPIADDILVNMNENSSLGVNVGAAVSDPENNPLTYTYGPSTPSITFVSTGNGVITVTSGLPGTYLIPYTVCDSSAFAPAPLCASGAITVTVIDTIAGVNNPPVANNDLVTTPINTPVIINPIANDFDVNGDTLTVTLLPGSPATVDPITGLITYTPPTGFVGVDSIPYSICDPSGACDTAFIVVTVSSFVFNPNVAPIATDDYATTDIITPVTVAVLNNDSDPNGNALTTPVTILTNPSTTGSVATANPNGTITFTPGPLFTAGTDSVQYLVCDNGAPTLCDTAWLFVTIAPINVGPTTTDVIVITSTDVPIGINVGAGTSDPQNDSLIYTYDTSTLPPGTIVVINGNGTITVTPPLGFTNDTLFFSFTVCDTSLFAPTSLCDSGLITVIVIDTTGGTNDAPIANDDLATTPIGTPVTVNPLGNDTDANGGPLTVSLLPGSPAIGTSGGTATVDPITGAVTYTPLPTFVGIDSIPYEVCDPLGLCDQAWIIITVSPSVNNSNVAPIATNDYAFIPEDSTITVAILNNDSDPNGNNIGLPVITGGPSFGTAVVNPGDSTITYTPGLNFYGTDTITYTICDDGNPILCDVGQLIIVVSPVNDAPITTDITVITSLSTPIGVNLGAGTSDPENDSLSYTYGVASIPNVIITVTGNGTINVTPPAGFIGTFTIPFGVCDTSLFMPNVLCDTGVITVIVVDTSDLINDDPIANNDLITTTMNTPVVVNPLGNDFDANGDPLTVSLVLGSPAIGTSGGTAVVNPLTGLVTYTPLPTFMGIDSIQYSICDPSGACDTAWIIITVSAVVESPNVKPLATDDFASTPEGVSVDIVVLNNDSDPNGNSINTPVIIVAPGFGPFNGTASVDPTTGVITYNPAAGFIGIDTLSYIICDNGTPVMCDTAEVYINVYSPNDPPSAGNEIISVVKWCDNPYVTIVNVLANNIDPNGDSLIVTVTGSSIMGGTVSVNSLGEILYTPLQNYAGQDTVIYTVCDTFVPAACITDTIFITVLPDNDCDSIPDNIDIDDDNDGIEDVIECATANGPCDTDGDGIPDFFDLDSDNDGIPDIVEAGGGQYDLNGDGVIDDTTDADNDGLFDVADGNSGGTYLPNPDFDGDTRPNFQDLDADNDGISDLVESGGVDLDGNGLIDNFNDLDNNGIDDNDAIYTPLNTDGDLNFDFLDLDADNDGISDILESGQPDANGDGTIDNPIDLNNDGFADAQVGVFAADFDNDGLANYIDLDADNDGIPDVVENGFVDANQDGFVDNFADGNSNGWNDVSEGTTLLNSDTDVLPDYLDLDADNDGIPDVLEGGQEDTNQDGLVDNYTDINNNGWSDDTEGDQLSDVDADGNLDYLDLDSDGDGCLDVTEGGFFDTDFDGIIDNFSDANNNGWSNSAEGEIIPDTDFDGVYNFRDLDSDNDGRLDVEECGLDCDNDGIPDIIDTDLCDEAVQIPNGFTPNGDGFNDVFVIEGIERFPNNSIQFFNRWGNIVYSTSDYQNDWSGTTNSNLTIGGEELPTGTYYYVFDTGTEAFGKLAGYIYIQR